MPEGIVVGVSVQEGCEFVEVVDDGVAGEDVAEDVKAEMAEMIDGMKAVKLHLVDAPHKSPFPEFPGLGQGEKSCIVVPKAEVQLDREGHVWVKGVAAPGPSLEAGQGGTMVRSTVVLSEVGLIANGLKGCLGTRDVIRWAKEVEVGLHAQARVGDVVG